ncbi:hypothetical protein [Fibrobacter sp.]|uniref:hypothetical protein n=1 Tax=Fibrobacter sp. TaxID=35828 RepID=UPI003865C606
MQTGNLGFIRMAAMDGVHDPQEIETNIINGERPMNRRVARRVKQAFAIAKRDPGLTAEFISDVLVIIGLLALVYIAWRSCRGCA